MPRNSLKKISLEKREKKKSESINKLARKVSKTSDKFTPLKQAENNTVAGIEIQYREPSSSPIPCI